MKHKLLCLLLAVNLSTLFAQENRFVSKEKYYMSEDFEILNSGIREKYLEFFPDEYEDPDYPIFDSDFGDYDESYYDFYHY